MQFYCALCGILVPARDGLRLCYSGGPCSRHRKLHLSETNLDQGQIS